MRSSCLMLDPVPGMQEELLKCKLLSFYLSLCSCYSLPSRPSLSHLAPGKPLGILEPEAGDSSHSEPSLSPQRSRGGGFAHAHTEQFLLFRIRQQDPIPWATLIVCFPTGKPVGSSRAGTEPLSPPNLTPSWCVTSAQQTFDDLIKEIQAWALGADSMGSDPSLRWAGSPPSPAPEKGWGRWWLGNENAR